MIGDLKPYAEYKDSGSRWLGNIPAHWEARNLRTLIRSRNERNRPDLPLLSVAREKGVFVRSLTDTSENHNVIPEDLSNYKVARSGSLVINKMKAWQGSMGIAPVDGLVSPAYFVYDFAISNRDYGQALLRSKPYVAHFGQASDGVRVGQWDLTITGMRAIPVLVPPPDEQAAIVRFLEWANARLERAIRAKRKVIALLNEQKQAIIHLAVTRGLDPSVPLKPSGIPWLGDIPGHWEMVRAKALFRQVATPVPVDAEQVTCFRDGQVTLRRNRRTTGFTNAIFELGYQGIHPGQLCLHSMDAFAGAIGVADSSGKCSPEYVICEPALARIIHEPV
jgi:type I restriction enzyme S subunit